MATKLGGGGVFYFDPEFSATTAYRILATDVITYDTIEEVGEPVKIVLKLKRTPHYAHNGATITLWTSASSTQDKIFICHDTAQDNDMTLTEDQAGGYNGEHSGIIRAIVDQGLYREITAYSYLYDVQAANISRVIASGTTIRDAMGEIYDSQLNTAPTSVTDTQATTFSGTNWTNPTYAQNDDANDATYATTYYNKIMITPLKAGAVPGFCYGYNCTLTGTEASYSYGDSSYLWNVAWTVADIKNSGFGLAIWPGGGSDILKITGFDFSSIGASSIITGIKFYWHAHTTGSAGSYTICIDYAYCTVYYIPLSQKDGTYDASNTMSGDWSFKNVGGQKCIRRLQRDMDSSNTKPLFFKEVNWSNTINFKQWDSTSTLATLSNANKGLLSKADWDSRPEDLCNYCTTRYSSGNVAVASNSASITAFGKKEMMFSMPEISSSVDGTTISTSMVNLLKNGRTVVKVMCKSDAVYPSGTLFKNAGVGYFYIVTDSIQNTSATLGLRKISYSHPANVCMCEFDTVPYPIDYFQSESSNTLGSLLSSTMGYQFANVPGKGTLLVSKGDDSTVQIQTGANGQALISDNSEDGGVKWGSVGVSGGGTGKASFTQGAIPYASAITTIGEIPAPTLNYHLKCTNATAGSVAYGWEAPPSKSHSLHFPSCDIYPNPAMGQACADLATTSFTSGGMRTVRQLAFDPTTKEYACFTTQMPADWNAGTVTATIIWVSQSTGDVIWQASGQAMGDADNIDVSMETAQQVTSAGHGAYYVCIDTTPAITVYNAGASKWVFFKINRKADDGSDTYGYDAWLLGVTINYTIN